MTPPGAPARIRFAALDGWRGVCALLVALFHCDIASHVQFTSFIANSYLFVDFFFVLSGFVITHGYLGRLHSGRDAADFLGRRFARVWPLHAFTLLLFVAVELARSLTAHLHLLSWRTPPFSGPTDPGALVANLLLLQSFGLNHEGTWNFPSWSIGAEFWTYVVAACVFLWGGRARTPVAILLAATGFAILAAASRTGMNATFELGFPRCLYGFFAGHLTYRLWRSTTPRIAFGGALEAASLALAVAFVAILGRSRCAYLSPLVFAAVVFAFAFEAGAASRLMKTRAFSFLGEVSYSIYMLHAFIVIDVIFRPAQFLEQLIHRTLTAPVPPALAAVRGGEGLVMLDLGSLWAGDGATLGFVAVLLGVSALSFRWVERPGRRLMPPRLRPTVPPGPLAPKPSAASP